MDDVRFLTVNEVLELHRIQINQFGGSAGIISENKLESAVQQPKQTFGGAYLHENLFRMAATYLSGIARNHAFVDGNKRTASQAAVTFLKLNGYQLNEQRSELADITIDHITREKTKQDVTEYLRTHSEKYRP